MPLYMMIVISDLIYGTYMHINPPYITLKYVAYMYTLAFIFVPGIDMAIACEADVIGCMFVHTDTRVLSITPCRTRAV